MQHMVSMTPIMSSAPLGAIQAMKAEPAWLLLQLHRQHTLSLRQPGELVAVARDFFLLDIAILQCALLRDDA